MKNARVEYGGSFSHTSNSKNRHHFIVAGHLNFASIVSFVRELFNNTLDEDEMQVGILCPDLPSNDLRLLLNNPTYKSTALRATFAPCSRIALQVAFSTCAVRR